MTKSAFAKAMNLSVEPVVTPLPVTADTVQTNPEYSIHLWLEGKDLKVRFKDSHTVTIDTERCRDGSALWPMILLNILQEQARSNRPRIAEASAPVQYDIEAIMRAIKHDRPENFRAKPTMAFEDMDLSDLTFD